jgi:phage/plasmid-like protein (TIGR03299 family)
MSANIFGDRFLAKREPAWHKLGETFEDPISMTQAVKRTGIDFHISKHPVTVQIDKGDEGIDLIPTKNFAVVREPVKDDNQYRVLSIVGREWTPIQAMDLARMLDPITEKYPVETIGALGYGEKIFMTLDAGESKICGEDHHLYFLVSDHRDGGGALQIAFTPVRVVCQNTLTAGLQNAKINVRLTHTRNIESDTEWYIGLFNQMDSAREEAVAVMNTLSTTTITKDEAETVVKSAYPDASEPRRLTLAKDITPDQISGGVWAKLLSEKKDLVEEYDKRVERVESIRKIARERYDVFNDEFTDLAKTPWAIWQAIVETEDYRKGHNDSSTSVFGTRAEAKIRAFNKAKSLV